MKTLKNFSPGEWMALIGIILAEAPTLLFGFR